MTILFPVLIMLLNAGAAVVCGCAGDWRRVIYWAAAAVITAAVTF